MKLTDQSVLWADVPSYEGLYEVSDTGVVRAKRRSGSAGKDLKQHLVKGYSQVWLSKNNKVRKLAVHRAVLMGFDRLPNDSEVCNHKDGNRVNNKLSNLEWCTREENEKHKRDVLGEDSKGKKNGNYGYHKSSLYPSPELRNRLVALGIPRHRHDLASLGEMLPDYCFTRKIKDGWSCNYAKPGSRINQKHAAPKHGDTEAEARGLMLEYLITNGLLKV